MRSRAAAREARFDSIDSSHSARRVKMCDGMCSACGEDGRDLRVAARGGQGQVGQRRVVEAVDQVVRDAGMPRGLGQDGVQDRGRLLLGGVGLVARETRSRAARARGRSPPPCPSGASPPARPWPSRRPRPARDGRAYRHPCRRPRRPRCSPSRGRSSRPRPSPSRPPRRPSSARQRWARRTGWPRPTPDGRGSSRCPSGPWRTRGPRQRRRRRPSPRRRTGRSATGPRRAGTPARAAALHVTGKSTVPSCSP